MLTGSRGYSPRGGELISMHARHNRGPLLFGVSMASVLSLIVGMTGVGILTASATPLASVAPVPSTKNNFAPLTGPVRAIEIDDQKGTAFKQGTIDGNANFNVTH